RAFWETFNMRRIGRSLHLDLYHSTSFFLATVPPAPRTVITVHDLTHFLYPQWHDALAGPRVRWRMARAIRRAEGIICVSEATRRDLRSLFPEVPAERAFVVPHGLTPGFNPEIDAAVRASLVARGVREPFVLMPGMV